MKSKKKLSLKKMTVSQLNSISGGNNDLTSITARNTSPILCNYASFAANCAPIENTILKCK